MQTLGINFSDKELCCLLHILVREPDANVGESYGEKSLTETGQDNSGYINYRDVYTLVRNYLRKQKVMTQSQDLGLDYHILTKASFDFLLRIKQVLSNQDDKVKKQEAVMRDFREAFAKVIQQRRMNEDMVLPLIEFDDFFDCLFMKFKIMCPHKDTLDHLKLLLCVQFGLGNQEKSYFLVQKVERVLYDLDYVYVNLIKILREPNHEKL